MKRKVGIVMPVYNAENFIDATLECLKNQTARDFIAVLVNDGSTDGTSAKLDAARRSDDRFVVLEFENAGPGVARNRGLEHIYGIETEYIIILDADDVYCDTMLEEMVLRAESTKADVVICRARQLDDATGVFSSIPYALQTHLLPKDARVFSYNDVKDFIFLFCVGWPWDKLYKSEFIKGTGLRFQALENTDDAYFVFSSLVKAGSITCLDKTLVSHRVNVETSVSNSREKSPFCFYEAILAVKRELISMGIFGELERGFLCWALNFCVWNFTSAKQETKGELFEFLKTRAFPELGFAERPREYYSFDWDYYEYDKIRKNSFDEYLALQKESNLKKLLRSIAFYGLKRSTEKAVQTIMRKRSG